MVRDMKVKRCELTGSELIPEEDRAGPSDDSDSRGAGSGSGGSHERRSGGSLHLLSDWCDRRLVRVFFRDILLGGLPETQFRRH